MEKQTISKYIVPVFSEAQAGCGFFTDNYFITSGHVTVRANLPLVIYYQGKRIRLDMSNMVECHYCHPLTAESSCFDYAVFKVDGIDSPLRISDHKPQEGEVYFCHTFNEEVTKNPQPGIPDIFTSCDEIVSLATEATIRKEVQGNFFAADSKEILKEGNSGSPLLDSEGRVVGILQGGVSGTPCCVFQYADIIKTTISDQPTERPLCSAT